MPTAICPECNEEVYVDADAEQSDVVRCDECGTSLVVVGLDPVEVDVYDEDAGDDIDDFDDGLDDDDEY